MFPRPTEKYFTTNIQFWWQLKSYLSHNPFGSDLRILSSAPTQSSVAVLRPTINGGVITDPPKSFFGVSSI